MSLSTIDEVRRAFHTSLDASRVVVMPDYFIDRIVYVPPLPKLTAMLKEKIKAGGGSIRNIRQVEVKGGNAVNLAYALGKLRVKTDLITLARGESKLLLEESFRHLRSVTLKIIEGNPGYTTALEFTEKNGHVNVMLSDIGHMDSIGPEKLDAKTVETVLSASVIAVVNWASNRRGTELAELVFKKAKKNAVRFIDPADFSNRKEEFTRFIKKASDKGLVTHLSINENESRLLSRELSVNKIPSDYSLKDVSVTCKKLSEELPITVDLHTPIGSASALAGEVHYASSPQINQVTATGAGDVWDAADLYGYLAGIRPDARLLLANMAASLYASNPSAEAPTKTEVSDFLETQKGKTEQPD